MQRPWRIALSKDDLNWFSGLALGLGAGMNFALSWLDWHLQVHIPNYGSVSMFIMLSSVAAMAFFKRRAENLD